MAVAVMEELEVAVAVRPTMFQVLAQEWEMEEAAAKH
jgi:hypothetical protein